MFALHIVGLVRNYVSRRKEPIMSDANTILKQMAIQIANDLEGANLHLQQEILDAELHIKKLKLQLESSRSAHQRSRDFSPMLGRDLQCPDCWVTRSIRSPLRPVPSEDRNDVFVCDMCNEEFVFAP